MLEKARASSGLRATVVRVGQLGGSSNGYWNPTEWFPSLVRSSLFLKCFPSVDKVSRRSQWFRAIALTSMPQSVSVLPVDAAARVMFEMRDAESAVIHLTHPHPIPWSTVAEVVTQDLGIQTVPYDVWFALLKRSGETCIADVEARSNPALKLMDFFTQAELRSNSGEAMCLPKLSIATAMETSESLRALQPLPGDVVRGWLRQWRASGFLP